MKWEFSFLLLHVAVQFSQHHLLPLPFIVAKKLTLHLDLVLGFLRTKATYRRRVYFGLLCEREKNPLMAGGMATKAGSWELLSSNAQTGSRECESKEAQDIYSPSSPPVIYFLQQGHAIKLPKRVQPAIKYSKYLSLWGTCSLKLLQL